MDLNRYVDKNIFHKNTDESLFACFNSLVEEFEEKLQAKEQQEAEEKRRQLKRDSRLEELKKIAMKEGSKMAEN